MSNGTGVELKISTDKAKQQINELISNLKKLHEMFDRTMELKVQADTTAIKTAEQDVTNLETTIGNVGKTELKLKVDSKELEKVTNGLKEAEEESKKAKKELTGFEKLVKGFSQTSGFFSIISKGANSLAGFSSDLTRWAGRTAQAVVGIFDRAVGGVSNLASEGFEQLQTLENSMAGYKAFFSEQPGGFDASAFKRRITETAERLPGLDTGGLADAIMQLAPLSTSSDQAFNASLGVMKAIKYSGGDSSELGYVIRNLRDVMSKGTMNERDRQQFLRAIPALEKILASSGQTQFLNENGKLEVPDELVGQFVEVFAKISENPEVNRVFEEMQNTTAGVLEKFKQTMQNSFIKAFETPGENGKSLVDKLKQFLNDNNIQKFADVIVKVGQKVADFVSTINFDELLDKLFSDAKELNEHIKKTLIPTIKELLGLDENSSTTDMIKRMMDVAKKFLKGMVDGFNTFLGLLKIVKNSVEKVFGNNSDFVAMLGLIAGFSKFGFKSISGIGNIVSSLAKLAGGLTTKSGKTLLGGNLSGGSGLVAKQINQIGNSRLYGGSGVRAGIGMLGGAAIALGGNALTNTITDFLKQNNSKDETLINSIDILGKTVSDGLAGLFLTGSPWGIAFGGLVGIVNGFSDAFSEYKAKQEEKEKNQNTELQSTIGDQAITLLNSEGLYTGDDNSLKAREWMAEYISKNFDTTNIKSDEAAKEAVNQAMTEYMKKYIALTTGSQLQEKSEDWQKNIEEKEYLATTDDTGKLVLKPEYESGVAGEMINKVYDFLVNTGQIASDQFVQSTQDKFQVIKDKGVNTMEELQAVFDYTEKRGGEVASMWEQLNSIHVGPELDEGKMSALETAFQDMLAKLGVGRDPETGNWYFKISAELSTGDSLDRMAEDNDISFGDSLDLQGQGLNEAFHENGFFGWFDELWNHTKQIELLKELKDKINKNVHKASGGPVKVRHFAGGGKPWGVDTVPTMLQPGEFVIRKSAAEKIGYTTLTAMNQGDLMAAYRNIGADISSRLNQINTSNNTDDHSYHRQVLTRQVINNYNYNRSGARNSIYRSFRNIAALTR